jgi:magnesium transporter
MQVSERLTTAVPRADAGELAGQVLEELSGGAFTTVETIYVVGSDQRLLGTVRLADLYAAPRNVPVGTLMTRDLVSVHPDLDQEHAATLAIRHDLFSLPVVGENDRFLGAFPPAAIMQVLREEHLEDIHHMAGIWHHSESARLALQAPPRRRALYRLPWLLLGLVGSMAAASLASQFEETLRTHIALAFFIPAIVYLADAVGTQSEAVAVRGLSLTDAGVGRLLLGEFSTGVLLGGVLASMAAIFTILAFGSPRLSMVVGISVLAACALATTIGFFLPWLFEQAGWDPALASGPIATIVQDVLTLLIYFGTAALAFP